MIFYNPQLMPNSTSAILYMVSNPKPFRRFDDHEAAIYIQLHQLVEQAAAMGDNPISLIEDYLELIYNDGQSVEEIASFLSHSDKMQSALWSLKMSWDQFDKSLPENSLIYGGMEKNTIMELYSEITLRSYLEALSQYKND